MKKLLIFGMSVVLGFCLAFGASAALLSPGISVLQNEVRMQKNGVAGNVVTFSAADFAAALAFIGVMMTFFKSEKVKQVGGILCGFGLLFVGLDLMG